MKFLILFNLYDFAEFSIKNDEKSLKNVKIFVKLTEY